jgi:single-strand DNA-binding protein
MTRTESSESMASTSHDGENNSTERRGDVNMVQIVGRLAADPELKRTSNDIVVVRFRVATNVRGRTEFHSAVAWRRLGELVARQFKKGDPIRVDGALHGRTWKNANGETRRTVEIIAEWCYAMPAMSN